MCPAMLQDSCFAYQQYLQPTQALLATLDGHGPKGHEVNYGRRPGWEPGVEATPGG